MFGHVFILPLTSQIIFVQVYNPKFACRTLKTFASDVAVEKSKILILIFFNPLPLHTFLGLFFFFEPMWPNYFRVMNHGVDFSHLSTQRHSVGPSNLGFFCPILFIFLVLTFE